jgi:DNA-binding NarL/FixJ family response regulator
MTNKQSIRILVADDDPLARLGILSLLSRHADLKVIGTAINGMTALVQARLLNPDLAILAISTPQFNGLPHIDGLQVTKAITGDSLKTRVIAFSSCDDSRHVERMFQAGARGYVCKEDQPDELVAGIRAVMRGQTFLSAKLRAMGLSMGWNPASDENRQENNERRTTCQQMQ